MSIFSNYSQRGLIISPIVIDAKTKTGVTISSNALSKRHLYQYITYWDVIDIPTNNIVHMEPSLPEKERLKEEGIYHSTNIMFQFSGLMPNTFAEDTVAHAYAQHNSERPGQWKVVAVSDEFTEDLGESKGRCIIHDLYRLLPYPHEDTPLDDLLEFREKNGENLSELRSILEFEYLEIISSGDPTLKLNLAQQKIEKLIATVDSELQKSGIKRVFDRIEFRTDLNSLGTQIASGIISAFASGSPIPAMVSTIGGVSSQFKIFLSSKAKSKIQNLGPGAEYVFGLSRQFQTVRG